MLIYSFAEIISREHKRHLTFVLPEVCVLRKMRGKINFFQNTVKTGYFSPNAGCQLAFYKKNKKIFKKRLDKVGKMWYNNNRQGLNHSSSGDKPQLICCQSCGYVFAVYDSPADMRTECYP